MQITWTKINEIIQETSDIRTYILDCPEGFTWEEGAHTHLALKGFNAGEKPNRSLVRHMSISTLPSEKAIGITTRIRENCSEFKTQLTKHSIGQSVALFKTHSNVPLKRVHRPVYLLSCGVGIATFRPLILDYLIDSTGIDKIHSLTIDSSGDYLFSELFATLQGENVSFQYTDNRETYYQEARKLAEDKQGLFYVVGSDDFLIENISLLKKQGIENSQIIIDKHEMRSEKFFL